MSARQGEDSVMDVLEIDFCDCELVARYDRLFESCPDALIQQSTYWCEAIRDLGPDRPLFLLCHDGGEDLAGLPLYLFEHPLGNILTSVPQPGPMVGIFCRGGLPEQQVAEIYRELLAAAVALARRYRCLTLTLITNPFADDLHLYERFLAPDAVLENFLQAIPLDGIFSDGNVYLPASRWRNNLSRNLRKGAAAGFRVSFCESVEHLRDWHSVHVQRHTELGAAPLSLRLFENLFTTLRSRNRAELILVEKRDEIASGCLFVYHRHIMDVFMLSMDSRFEGQAPNYVPALSVFFTPYLSPATSIPAYPA